MLRLLGFVAVLVLSAPVAAGPMSRWTISSLERVDAIAVAGRTQFGILAMTFDGKFSRSLDGGKTWSSVQAPGFAINVPPYGFAVGSPHDSRTWYVLFGTGTQVTRDAGETWSPANIAGYGLAIGATEDLMYLPPRSEDGFLGTPGRPLQISTDRGATWRPMSPPPTSVGFVRGVAPSLSDARVVYTWGSNGVARSDDQGATWRDVSPPMAMPLSGGLLYGLAVDRIDADVIYANAFGNLEKGLFASRDGGRTWNRTSLEWIVNVAPDPVVSGRAYALTFNATVYETRDAGLTWATVEGVLPPSATPGNSGPPWMTAEFTPSYYRPGAVVLTAGRRAALSVGWGTLASVDLAEGPLALASDLWWNPAAPGTGLTITQHPSNQVFMVWYTYDATGKQVWRVMPGGSWNDRVLTGTLYETDGPPYFQGAFDASRVKLTAVGSATLDFSDHNNATVVHSSATGTVQSRTPISRMQFGDLARTYPENYADIWYNASESGWGLGVSQQGERIFATWYVYGEDGEPMWIIMPDAVLRSEFIGVIAGSSATGDIYTTRGNAGGGYTSTKVGTARIFFRSTGSADLEYTAFGKSSTVQVTRIPF